MLDDDKLIGGVVIQLPRHYATQAMNACVSGSEKGRMINMQLAARGSTLNKWSQEHGFDRRTVAYVITGSLGRRGTGKSGAIIDALLADFGVDCRTKEAERV